MATPTFDAAQDRILLTAVTACLSDSY